MWSRPKSTKAQGWPSILAQSASGYSTKRLAEDLQAVRKSYRFSQNSNPSHLWITPGTKWYTWFHGRFYDNLVKQMESYPHFMVEETETRSSCVICPGYLDIFWERVCYGVSSYGHYIMRSLSCSSCLLWTPCRNKLCPRTYSKGSSTGFRIPVN